MPQVLNALQMWRKRSADVRYGDVKGRLEDVKKDEILRLNPFTATSQLFNRSLPFRARYESFFVDYSLVPLLVQVSALQIV